MIVRGVLRPLSLGLAVLLAVSGCYAQAPAAAAQAAAQPATPPQATPPAVTNAKGTPVPDVGAPISITVLEGAGAINSLTLLHSTPPIIEVKDQNEFPMEGVVVTFTLPATGPGGTFAGVTGNSFTVKSDSHGQAAAPLLVPSGKGKFGITVTAVSGNRKAEIVVQQTNAEGAGKSGREVSAAKPWYKKKLVWIIAGGAAAGTITAILLTRGSSSSTGITVTPGTPVFH